MAIFCSIVVILVCGTSCALPCGVVALVQAGKYSLYESGILSCLAHSHGVSIADEEKIVALPPAGM